MGDHCETCGRRLSGRLGELYQRTPRGSAAWCVEHARHRPPWFGRAGWPWMRELDRLWAKAEEAELELLLKKGGRDLIFDHPPPLDEGEVRRVGKLEVRVLWVRQSQPGRWTVRVSRKEPERALMLRTGSLPFTSDKRGAVHAPKPGEVERASVESAYQSYEDPLDAGQVISDPKDASRARLRRATAIKEAIET